MVERGLPDVVGVPAGVALALGGVANVRRVRREPPPPLPRWVPVDIPLGTALPEELLFRGALTPRFEAVFGHRIGAIVGALTFGLWHIGAATAAADPVIPTVAVTALAGADFDAIARRTRRSWPSIAAHWAVNSVGAILSRG